MSITLLYWHWMVFGMFLILAELVIPSFTIFWFGLGAVIVSIALICMPDLGLASQLVVWSLASVVMTAVWFLGIKRLMVNRTTAGIAADAIVGERGQVITAASPNERGTVRFVMPLLGSSEWSFICETEVAVGDRVYVKSLSGNTLIVETR